MELMIRPGEEADVRPMLALLDEIREQMDRKDWFYLDTHEMVLEQWEQGRMRLWVAMDGDILAGVLYVLIPGLERYNYGYCLDFSREELMQVVNMDTAAVAPGYRGMGLQRRLLEVAERSFAGSDTRILLCTIHPENQYSLNNAQKGGYVIQKELPKYGSVRYVLRKDIL